MKFLKKISIRIQFLCFILLFTLLPTLIVSFIINRYCIEVTDKTAEQYIEAVYKKMDNNISEYLFYIKTISNQILSLNPLYNTLTDDNKSFNEKNDFLNEAMGVLLSESNSENNGIYAAEIITGGERFCYPKNKTESKYTPSEEFLKKCNRTDITVDKNIVSTDDGNFLVLGQRMYNFYSGADIGWLILYVNEEEMWQNYKDIILEDSSVYMTIDDYVISHSDKSMLGYKVMFPNMSNMDIYSYDVHKSDNLFLIKNEISSNLMAPRPQIVQVLSVSNVFKSTQRIRKNILEIALFGIILSILLSVFIPNKLLRGLVVLKKRILMYMSGVLSGTPELFHNEVAVLEDSFYKMIEQIEKLSERNKAEMKQKKDAELRALSSQINPHFIYNALDTAVWTIKLGNPEDAEKILRALGMYYRIGLHKGSLFISVREELEHVKMYIEIEAMRHMSRKFSIEYDVPPDILDYYILKIVLQPLVENCIKHGFKGIKSGGIIRIRGRMNENKDIVFTVEDNGTGCRQTPLEIKKDKKDMAGYGIKNINERLILEYGEDYALKFSESELGGLCVTVKLKPFTELP